MSRSSAGPTKNCAPAHTAATAVSASSTVPAPISISSGEYRAARSSITRSAPGTVIVISMISTPPAFTASAILSACSELSARTTAITPHSTMRFITLSFFIFPGRLPIPRVKDLPVDPVCLDRVFADLDAQAWLVGWVREAVPHLDLLGDLPADGCVGHRVLKKAAVGDGGDQMQRGRLHDPAAPAVGHAGQVVCLGH